MPYYVTKSEALTLLHICRDVSGSTVTGQAAALTYVLRDESGNSQTTGVTIAEQSSTGYYNLTFTPDAVGNWHLAVTNPAFPDADGQTTDYYIQVVTGATVASGSLLATLSALKERLNITTTADDTYLTNVLGRATKMVEAVVGRTLTQTTHTEYLDGRGTRCLNLRHGPISSVASVDLISYSSTGSESASSVSAGDWVGRGTITEGWKLKGYVEAHGAAFVSGVRNYKVIYTAGYNTVPADLEEATLHAAVFLHNKRKDTGTDSRDIGQGAESFRSMTELRTDLADLLAPYISVQV